MYIHLYVRAFMHPCFTKMHFQSCITSFSKIYPFTKNIYIKKKTPFIFKGMCYFSKIRHHTPSFQKRKKISFLKVNFLRSYTLFKNSLCERLGKLGLLKKRFGCFFKAPLFLGKWCVVTTYFLYKKNKKKLIQLYMIKMLHCYWLNQNKYKLDRLNLTRLWVLVTIYQKKNTWLFDLVIIYPKIKRKTKHRSTYLKETKFGG